MRSHLEVVIKAAASAASMVFAGERLVPVVHRPSRCPGAPLQIPCREGAPAANLFTAPKSSQGAALAADWITAVPKSSADWITSVPKSSEVRRKTTKTCLMQDLCTQAGQPYVEGVVHKGGRCSASLVHCESLAVPLPFHMSGA